MVEFEHLEYWDKDIWRRCFDSLKNQGRINNIYTFAYFHKMLIYCNEEPKSPLF